MNTEGDNDCLSDLIDKSPKMIREAGTTKGKFVKKNLDGFAQYI